MILFCLPYAGGSEMMYYGWKRHLDSSVQLEPIELKGRGQRYNENFYEDFDEAIEDIFQYIKNKIAHDDYAIYGHSMGSLLAYELYYKICDENLRRPIHIFFSGNTAPNVEKKSKTLHTLSDDEFLKEIMDLGGTPEELLKDEELLQLFLPVLRNDIKLNENYVYTERENKIECGITIFTGKDDEEVTLGELLAWKNHCNNGFKVYTLEGNHFFINNNTENITNIINSLLTP